MNENLNLIEILKDCPKGTKLYSIVHGDVYFHEIRNHPRYPIAVTMKDKFDIQTFTSDGKILFNTEGECVLFPSKEQKDWSKFNPKQSKFDPKTMQPFDKVLARLENQGIWFCEWFSFIEKETNLIKCCGAYYKYCIPYNEDTEHLVGTTDDAPEFYRYWED